MLAGEKDSEREWLVEAEKSFVTSRCVVELVRYFLVNPLSRHVSSSSYEKAGGLTRIVWRLDSNSIWNVIALLVKADRKVSRNVSPMLEKQQIRTKGGDDDVEENERGSLENESITHDKSQRPEIPTKDNPVIVAIYGQISSAEKSHQSAIFHLLHAYDYCPDDRMILCLAIASAGRAMQRQSDNRHHLVVQVVPRASPAP
ncbi:hypothetical protein BYT27DRAFT_7214629 [Phlegmacium glaucopus]|nr:hypothetical protein BYT27DRAFT_7214629 [Phlegmacium glaucopus]